MSTSLIDTDTMLVVDVGAVSTRAMFFDVVDGRYRFVAAGTAPTTAGAPFRDVSEGVRNAIDHLQNLTGRTFLDPDERLIVPTAPDGTGVDAFSATLSAGPALNVLTVGLLEDVSLESVKRLAATTYTGALEHISLNDRRKVEARIDAVVRLRPDLILVAGGTDGGASRSVMKLIEAIGLACFLLPDGQRPELLYAGNTTLQDEIKTSLEKVTNVHVAPNIRPALEVEQLEPAQAELSRLFTRVRARQIPGVQELNEWTDGRLLPSASAFGRVIRFLSKAHSSAKGVLGVDLGASALTVAASFAGNLTLGVYPQLGLGPGLGRLLEIIPIQEIMSWLTYPVSERTVREYLQNKAIYPASVPAAVEDLAIEQALARVLMRSAIRMAAPGFRMATPAFRSRAAGRELLPWFEPIIATGSVLTHSPSLSQTLLTLLDGLQPTGATTMILDQNHLAPGLGAAAAHNPLLAVQVLDSNAFMHLGTVISPVGRARPGTPVMHIKMTHENGQETNLEVKQGSLEILRLPPGQTARIHLQALHRFDVGMGGAGRSGGMRVVGGTLGVIIDARGRPLALPEDMGKRQEAYKKWLWVLGG